MGERSTNGQKEQKHKKSKKQRKREAKFLLRGALRKLEEEENWEERRKANAHLKAMTELVRRVPAQEEEEEEEKTSS